ncbi:helix-turn-helix domain-containing protein [Vibrio genomosp. F10]|uniref:helix-turn-helix domain-containing protein n=1 Tax=Vibrio genomosp. F10 TaxID=723171 RepID=UPI0002DCBC98|nr:AraC family transcriptional regulator [Vibrio genomosp. F10]OEE96310.1 transcriptional regulator [Vibrio genomosp. F10 str. 9ZD137]
MYDPIKDGMEKSSGTVIYNEAKPPQELKGIIHSYWQLKTDTPLEDDFTLHAIPDACINILFNQKDTDIAGITGLKTTYVELNLGKDFNYAGVQFFPGVWQGNRNETKDSFVGSKYLGQLPLIGVNIKTAPLSFSDKLPIFTELVSSLVEQEVVKQNNIVQKILDNLDRIHSVSQMAEIIHHSPRQLQRILKQETGFSPHDFLKVMRLQQSLKEHNVDRYTDQSHFIRSFKKITGYTPTDYFRIYDV